MKINLFSIMSEVKKHLGMQDSYKLQAEQLKLNPPKVHVGEASATYDPETGHIKTISCEGVDPVKLNEICKAVNDCLSKAENSFL